MRHSRMLRPAYSKATLSPTAGSPQPVTARSVSVAFRRIVQRNPPLAAERLDALLVELPPAGHQEVRLVPRGEVATMRHMSFCRLG